MNNQKTIFITGASTGLGKATAQLFQQKGWNVIATMRNPEKETELSQLENVSLLQLDISNLEQIKTVTQQAIALHDIDVVFNNAGYGLSGALEALSDEQIVRQIDTNLLGTIRVTQSFIPYFRNRKNGLFLNTTAIGAFVAFPFVSTYHATKWALEGWSESLSFELGLFNIGVKTIVPGGIRSDFGRSMEVVPHPVYDEAAKKVHSFAHPDAYATPEQIAEVVYEAATDNKDQLRYFAGEDAFSLYNRRLEVGTEAFRKEIRKMIFGT